MSQYATLAEFAQFGLPMAATENLYPEDVEAQIQSASATADSYLASRGYSLPLDAWGSDIKSAVSRIAAWSILVNLRGVNPEDPAHAAVRLGQQDAMQWLRDVAKGVANADIATTSPVRRRTGTAGVIGGGTSTRGW